jgi:hypothetical protein
MTIAFTLNLYTILILVVAILAIIDGIYRARGRGGVLPILTIIVAVLLGLSAFISVPFGTQVLAIVLLILLILVLVFRGSTKRGSVLITVLAIILDALLILHNLGWLTIPNVF